MEVENRVYDGGAMLVWVDGFCGFPINGFMSSDLLVAVVVVCVVGFCRFSINGFMGFDLLVAVVVIDFGLCIRWLWVEERDKIQRRRRERERKIVFSFVVKNKSIDVG